MIEYFIAKKIHSGAEGKGKATPPAVRIAMAGIALGLAVMVLSVAIIVGFKKEVRNKVIGFGSHIQITNFDNNASYEYAPIAPSDTLLKELSDFPGIRHVEAFATKLGMIKTDEDFQGVVLKGVGMDYDWSFFHDHLKEGELPVFEAEGRSTDILLSRYLCDLLGLKLGDPVRMFFIQDDVRALRFQIKGIYDSGSPEFDKLFVLGDIRQIRRLNGWENDQVSGLELLVDDYDRLDDITENVYFFMADKIDHFDNLFYTRSIKDLNPVIFHWLGALDINVVLILVLMMAVSGFTMISGLLIIILERINMIGVLKALGQRNASIRKVFLYIAFFLIGKGMLWGNMIAVAVCLLQQHFKIFKLNPADYYVDAVPIDLNILHLVLINIGALAAAMGMMFGATYMITKVEPVKSIRFD